MLLAHGEPFNRAWLGSCAERSWRPYARAYRGGSRGQRAADGNALVQIVNTDPRVP